MKNVSCTVVEATNTVFVWGERNDLVAMVTAGEGGEAELTIYGVPNKPTVLSFNDLEIIQDNWNQLQEMRRWEDNRRKSLDSTDDF